MEIFTEYELEMAVVKNFATGKKQTEPKAAKDGECSANGDKV